MTWKEEAFVRAEIDRLREAARSDRAHALTCISIEHAAYNKMADEKEAAAARLEATILNGEDYPLPRYGTGRCLKCGNQKTVDMFKGEYCPVCNDWC